MALAPEQAGIGIRRYFTTPEVHPYDEVAWERRDARITNFRDGTVAFEQLDVELPTDWSLNATNILAQKYFRGTVGTAERETSLRQVVDRVADTITAWGVQGGYFVDDDEAEAFRAELKHLVVTQKAAFNSPVWFNIGVNGVPQQASACQPYDALVSTPDGLRPIGELVEGNEVGAKVFDAQGVTQVVAVKANGVKPVLRIHTKSGHILDVTSDHLVWRAGPGKRGFVEAGTLQPGDKLTWHRTESSGIGHITETAIAEAALAGWLQSDGFVGQYDHGTNRSLTAEFLTVTDAEHAWVTEALDVLMPDVHRHEREFKTVRTDLDGRRIRLYGEPLRSFVDSWGLLARGPEMTVPARLHDAPLPVVAAYLRSIFQAEGYVSIRDRAAVIGLDMVSEGVVRGAQQLLSRFGIFSRVRFKADKRADRLGCWSLSIRPLPDRRRFADEIGFIDSAKAEKLAQSLEMLGIASSDSKRLEIRRIEDRGELPVYDIQTESGEYLSSNLRLHNCFILHVDDTMDSILNWYVEEGTIFKGGSGSGINLSGIRSSHERLKGGGTASGPVSFMRGADASAGTIKSGGKTRRAAKMVILNVDHPDIEDFIWCKAVEERKARVLRDAGFDMDLDGKDSHSTQYQNANNSVRVTDEFMQAVVDDADWHLRAVTTGEVVKSMKARDLMRQIAEAAWECADPGMQFDTTINRWHTAAATGRINGSNPCCFVGETLVDTADGPIRFEILHKMAEAGLPLPNARTFDESVGGFVERPISRVWISGRTRDLVEVRTRSGLSLRCTPEHRFLTSAGAYVEAQHLTQGQDLRRYSVGSFARGTPVGALSDIDVVVGIERWEPDGEVAVYDLEVGVTHNFVVRSEGADCEAGVVVHNSEYMHLDNSACNLASLNLLKFLDADDQFDVEGYKRAVEVVFTAQEILVGNADYPTESIADTSRRFRQLGLGYANLGALLMALGLPYDSDAGRAWAGALTALMTGHAYLTSARTAARMGPFAGYSDNREHMLRVLDMHRKEAAKIDEELVPADLLAAAQESWDDANDVAAVYGVRNSQASVIAPTGCLVGGTLVATDRGLLRLGSLGDPDGAAWQHLDITVQTDDGPERATKFFVNGAEPVVDVVTNRGYRIKGTTKHRIKVVDADGRWVWRHFADVRPGDTVPLALGQLLGSPQPVHLPPVGDGYRWLSEYHVRTPDAMSEGLAELVGYFMGDGSLHAKGLRLCVTDGDDDVVHRLTQLCKELFGIEARVEQATGYSSVNVHSVRLAAWWEACGFAKRRPHEAHIGKGWVPHIPEAVLHSNDPVIYRAFVRGLFEADGTATGGTPSWTTTSFDFSHDLQSLMLALGFVTTRREQVSGRGSRLAVLRLLNSSTNERWLDEVGFISARKARAVYTADNGQAARHDHIPMTRALIDRVAPENTRNRKVALMGLARAGSVSRRLATQLFEQSQDVELARLLGFFFDRVVSAELGDEELTYDISVPSNVTYVANGFISHNTIGLLMDCDTTGLEPDLGLVKMKKLVGGGNMSIVNQTIPRALCRLGYSADQIDAIIAHIDEHKSILGAPHLAAEHVAVFACSMGDNTIHYMGHIRMMAAIQPFISGALSKTVNVPEDVTVEDVEQLHIDAWQLGIKAVAMYRDNCKVAQPLSTVKKEALKAGADDVAEAASDIVERIVERVVTVKEPVRQKLPRNRTSRTFEFRVADCKGFVTVGEYVDGRPGEIFMRVSKQGSTLAGIMDAFAISVSYGLQYGVPLRVYVETFTNMRFEPAGMTDDPDLRFATSLIDYIFRRLAVDYLSYEERAELNILTIGERTQPTLPGVEETAIETRHGTEMQPDPPSIESALTLLDLTEDSSPVRAPAERAHPSMGNADAPICMQCGVQMQRAGSCHACPSCGSTSGCS